METQKENLQKLYESGVLTKEEMEVELKKISKPIKRAKAKSILWWVVGVIIAVIGLTFTLIFTQSNSTPSEGTGAETAQWEITNIDGVRAVQAQFHNQDHGILQVTYSPSFGIRFGLFDSSMKQIALTSAVAGFSRIVTKEEVVADYEKRKANGFADEEWYQMYLNDVGDLCQNFIVFPSYKDGYIYYNGLDAEKFFSLIDNGAAKSLLLRQTVESMDDSDFPEVIEYEWLTKFKSGEFSTLISKL